MYNTPILFLIFNRPDVTEMVFEAIRKVRPKYLFVAADGARPHKTGEKELCEQTRNIINKVDWDCEVKTLFREENLGCKMAVSSAITWFFDNVEEGIILEDDCLPSQSFFRFCEEMLEYYRHDERIMHISGNNPVEVDSKDTYYFAKLEFCWGWATWKRAWKYFDVEMKDYEEFKNTNQIKNIFEEQNWQDCWISAWNMVYSGKLSSWAFIWTYTILKENGVCITSVKNLIRNIGFGEGATHTAQPYSPFANQSVLEVEGDIIHPKFKLVDKSITEKVFEQMYGVTKNTLIFDREKETLEEFLVNNNLKKRIEKLSNQYKDKKVMIYGAGEVFRAIKKNFDLSKLNVIGIADMKFKDGEEFEGYRTYSANTFLEEKPDVVLIAMLQNNLAEHFFKDALIPKYGNFHYEAFLSKE